jgi:formylglycine-generating enzyme required for sulfatase activity
MVGNVREWTADLFTPYRGGEAEPQVNPNVRVIRGPGWEEAHEYDALATNRWGMDGAEGYVWAGFRCAKDAD